MSSQVLPGPVLLPTAFPASSRQRALLEARVPLRTQITLADRIGQWPQITITALTIAPLAAAIAARVKGSGATAASPGSWSMWLTGGRTAARMHRRT